MPIPIESKVDPIPLFWLFCTGMTLSMWVPLPRAFPSWYWLWRTAFGKGITCFLIQQHGGGWGITAFFTLGLRSGHLPTLQIPTWTTTSCLTTQLTITIGHLWLLNFPLLQGPARCRLLTHGMVKALLMSCRSASLVTFVCLKPIVAWWRRCPPIH